jgi:PBSX family phage terminase large subunit
MDQLPNPKAVENFIAEAAKAGLPQSQVENFIKGGYVPFKWALPVHAAMRQADTADMFDEIALGGSRNPGKSHLIMAQVGLDDCQRIPGLKVLFLRKVMKTAGESFDDLVRKVFAHVDCAVTAGRVVFSNGSRILIGGFNNESDIDKYLGIEYDIIVIEEATQLTEDKYNKIRGSLRTSRTDWRTRMYLSTNPGSIGHVWFKKKFVLPWRNNTQVFTRFYPATYRDNPTTTPEYKRYLEGLAGKLGKAWRDGDWDIFEGVAFPGFDPMVHVCEPFEIPEEWPRWRGVDWGSGAPFCCLWAAKDIASGRKYVYREAYQARLSDQEQARLIRTMTPPAESINVTYADPSMWTERNKEGQWYSSANEYAAEGVPLTKGNNQRIAGKRNVERVLNILPDGRPELVIFDTCEHLVEQLGNLVLDEHNVEDVDTKQEDHAYDSCRYLLTQEQEPEEEEEQVSPIALAFGMRGRSKYNDIIPNH